MTIRAFACITAFCLASALLVPLSVSCAPEEPDFQIPGIDPEKEPELYNRLSAEIRKILEQETGCVLSIHRVRVYGDKSEDCEKVVSFTGQEIEIIREHLIYSGDITDVDAIEIPNKKGFFGLKVMLSKEGRKRWDAMASKYEGKKLALLVDGIFYRLIEIHPVYSAIRDEVILEGPFDRAMARKIDYFAPKNYAKAMKNAAERAKTQDAATAAKAEAKAREAAAAAEVKTQAKIEALQETMRQNKEDAEQKSQETEERLERIEEIKQQLKERAEEGQK